MQDYPVGGALDNPAMVDGYIPATAAVFPERAVVSFGHRQDFFVFYSMVNDLLRPDDLVVDLGAGRGAGYEFGGPHLRYLSNLKGRCRKLVGIDVDPVVLTNRHLDEAAVIGADGRLPLPDASVDLVISYAVLEHVANPEALVSEIDRVLKPGGRFCAWTPNRWGYIAIGARLIPNRLHKRLLHVIAPGDRGDEDVFPTAYRMNTLGAIRRLFPAERFINQSFTFNGLPVYNFGSPLMARLLTLYMAITPRALAQCLFVFIQKRRAATG